MLHLPVLRWGQPYTSMDVDPVVHFTSGPLAGKDVYYGHTHTALAAGQQFKAGDVISHTGLSGVWNATVGGWAEIGFWPPGSMDAGSQIAPLLHS